MNNKDNNKLTTPSSDFIIGDKSQYMYPIDKSKIPEAFLDNFKIKNVDFKVDEIEELIMQDIMQSDENTRIKLNRDVTNTFLEWIDNKIEKKENVSLNTKGNTRSGKSLVNLKLVERTNRKYKKPFDTLKIVCANQKEYRQKLQTAKFGDSFQIDENAFANVGDGSMTELQQLKDVQNIIAKENIHTFYITPRNFLPTGAIVGLSYWGKDSKNWLSRFLLYSLKGSNPILLGFVMINVGDLFNDYGCFFNRLFGGCTNPNRLTLREVTSDTLEFDIWEEDVIVKKKSISRDFLKYSSCIPSSIRESPDIINKLNLTSRDIERKSCPFFRICQHPLCQYEIKKDGWILREMTGGLDERQEERYRVALGLIQRVGFYNADIGKFMLRARNGKDLNVKVNLFIPQITNTKFTKVEKEEIISIIQSVSDIGMFKEIVRQLGLDYIEELNKIDGTEELVLSIKNTGELNLDD